VLIPQIVPGHRMWAMAAKKTERFIATHDIQYWSDHPARQMWLKFYFVANDLTRLSITHARLLAESRLGPDFREVSCNETHNGQPLLCFEQVNQHQYQNYPADELHALVAQVRNRLWMTVATVPPYRRFYVYLAPTTEQLFIVPQLLSIYAITYYLALSARGLKSSSPVNPFNLFTSWHLSSRSKTSPNLLFSDP
jgi:hypothetical protein